MCFNAVSLVVAAWPNFLSKAMVTLYLPRRTRRSWTEQTRRLPWQPLPGELGAHYPPVRATSGFSISISLESIFFVTTGFMSCVQRAGQCFTVCWQPGKSTNRGLEKNRDSEREREILCILAFFFGIFALKHYFHGPVELLQDGRNKSLIGRIFSK